MNTDNLNFRIKSLEARLDLALIRQDDYLIDKLITELETLKEYQNEFIFS